ncbi:unnamed protein product, partial [Durusdinium trenchii]
QLHGGSLCTLGAGGCQELGDLGTGRPVGGRRRSRRETTGWERGGHRSRRWCQSRE